MIVERHPTDSEQGIFASHMSCLRAGLAAGAQTIGVFEDDIIFRRFSTRRLDDAAKFMRSETPWNVLFLGCFVFASRKTAFRSVLKVRYQCSAHAYVVTRRFAQQLVDTPWSGMAFDDMVRSLVGEQAYVLYPSFAFQSDAATDNQKMIRADRIRRWLGGCRVLQGWNEFSHHHVMGLIIGHVLFVLAVIVMVLLRRR